MKIQRKTLTTTPERLIAPFPLKRGIQINNSSGGTFEVSDTATSETLIVAASASLWLPISDLVEVWVKATSGTQSVTIVWL